MPAETGIKWLTAAEGKKLGLQAVWGTDSKPVVKDGLSAFYAMSDETFLIDEKVESWSDLLSTFWNF